jgi:hypothetical protein
VRAKPPGMTQHVASRTLVKSPPELWAECSDAASLARHLDGFGEIRITRLEPETAVAWEGERARGTVRIEPSGWGTKVILTAVADPSEVGGVADADRPEEPSEVAAVADAEPSPEVVAGAPDRVVEEAKDEVVEEPERATDPPPARPRRRRLARWFAFLRAPEPAPTESTAPAELPEAESAPPELPLPAELVETDPAPESEPEPAGESPRAEATTEPPPAEATAEPSPAEATAEPSPAEAALTAALDSLGQAHHRPYSRA